MNTASKGNIRDYATIEQLLILTNLENLNASWIEQGLPQYERLEKLHKIAVYQSSVLAKSKGAKTLNYIHNQLKLPTDE